MSDLKVGDKIRDNDPRMNGRVLTVIGFYGTHVDTQDSIGFKKMQLRKRIYTDGKPRRSGFSLIEQA